MGVQTDDAGARPGAASSASSGDLEQRHAELRVRAGGAHVLVMPSALPRVDADEKIAAAEQIRPMLQRIQIVQREPDFLLDGPGIFLARSEVRREEDALAVDAGKEPEHARNLARRDAFEVHAVLVHAAQHLRVRVGLHREEHLVDGR